MRLFRNSVEGNAFFNTSVIKVLGLFISNFKRMNLADIWGTFGISSHCES